MKWRLTPRALLCLWHTTMCYPIACEEGEQFAERVLLPREPHKEKQP
jgi:hypothetical protein